MTNTTRFYSYVESNEQTKLTRKMGTDSQVENRMSARGGRLADRGIEQKRKGTHGHGQQCGDCWGRGIKALKGDEKYNKDYKNKERKEKKNFMTNLKDCRKL